MLGDLLDEIRVNNQRLEQTHKVVSKLNIKKRFQTKIMYEEDSPLLNSNSKFIQMNH